MLIDRSDHVINVCEMKFSGDEYVITEDENRKLRRRLELFRTTTGTKKGLLLTMITSNGVKRNANSAIVNSEVTLDDLFA